MVFPIDGFGQTGLVTVRGFVYVGNSGAVTISIDRRSALRNLPSNQEAAMADKVFAGTVVLPDRIVDDGYVLVGDGMVQSVGSGALPDGEKHGGPGFLVLPGAIDAQVHSRSQLGQEDFIWSTRSAAAGGVTTIVDMPYDDNCLIATAERFRTKVSGSSGAGAR